MSDRPFSRVVSVLLALLLFFSLLVPAGAEETEPDLTLTPDLLTQEEHEQLLAALPQASIPALSLALHSGLLSCRELTDFFCSRIDALEDTYNCFITLCDGAGARADELDALLAAGESQGLLFGLPVVIKDNMDLAGYPTSNGRSLKGVSKAKSSADAVQSLLDAGAVPLGKTNMSTAAQSARHSISTAGGQTRNAYSTKLSPGGSSGGTAVAVSLGLAVAGLGTDTNSSLRIPAALNGCIALRPTTGLISRTGVRTVNRHRDTVGAITRTVTDSAVMLDVLTGGDYAASLNPGALKGARLGIIKEISGVTGKNGRTKKAVDPEITDAFARAVTELESCGAEVVEISFPRLFTYVSECTKSTYTYGPKYYSAFKKLLDNNDLDAVIFPAYLSRPLSAGYKDGVPIANTQTWVNNTHLLSPPMGIPEISVPIGSHSTGAGIAMEIAARKNEEQLLLDLAYSYTLCYDHRAVPVTDEALPEPSCTIPELLEAVTARLTAPPEPEIEPPAEPEVEIDTAEEEEPIPEQMLAPPPARAEALSVTSPVYLAACAGLVLVLSLALWLFRKKRPA